MSLSSPYQEHYYVADGVTTTFAFGSDFTALSSSYVKCIIYFDDGTNCVPTFNVDLTTGYISIVTLTKPDGTVLTVPPAGSIVRVFRDVPEQQNVTASQLQNYTAKQLERIFDSVVAMIQEVSYSDLHKTIRLTETQRDVSMEQLKEENDQAILYWDFETRQLKATDYGQNQVVKSDTVDRLVYLQPEGKIYFIPKGSNNPIAIGSATIHNDLSGRNAPDCHPESAITGLREHLQELRDADTALAEDVQIALNRSQEAKDTADEAKETAEYAQTIAGEAKDIAEDAKETAEGIESIAQEAKDTADEAKEIAQDAKDIAEGVVEDIEAVEEGLANHIADKANPHEVTKAQIGLGNVDNTSDLDKPISTATQTALDGKQDVISDLATIRSGAALGATAVQPGDLATVATTGDYDDLLNKPTIPTVNDATLTIQKNGTNVATFTANSSTNATANISVPTDTGDLTNGAGFITGITSSDVTNALGYTPYSDANPNGYTSNVGTVTSVNSVSPDGSGNVSLTIPTVNDATITITQGGVTKGSFTLNQASGDTIALDAGGGVGNIDNLTITENASQEIQAVATINANTAVGATNPLYDWVGTLAEYEAQDIETNHPEWVCYITDDFTAQAYSAYTKSETNNMFVQKGHEVIEFQEPNAGNNYTWYRKYADGWVEQGGITASASANIVLPIEMADANYTVMATILTTSPSTSYYATKISSRTTTGFTATGNTIGCMWQVSGMAA